MMKFSIVFVLLFGVSNAIADDSAPLRMVWDGNPINIDLHIGKERQIHFPEDVWLDIPNNIDPLITTTIVNNVVYWQANHEFESTRIIVGEESNPKNVYLVNLSGKEDKGASLPNLNIMREAVKDVVSADGQTQAAETVGPLSIKHFMQFAAREFYSPERLRLRGEGYQVTSINRGEDYSTLYRTGGVDIEPLIAWRKNDLYVTAFKFINTTSHRMTLDMRHIRGKPMTALPKRYLLTASGTTYDNTIVFIASDSPFDTGRLP